MSSEMDARTRDRLYNLLPAFTRIRDAQSGDVLRALLTVLSTELGRVQGNIEQLYDNWFIETCDEWVVPYIGDLFGVGPHYVFDAKANSLRPFIANTLGFRRRKGTAAMLEDLTESVTGWRARAVEMFQLLAATQHVNHLRPDVHRTPNLRDTDGLELLGGPFEQASRFVDVRHIENDRGKYNIPHLGIFVWRLLALEMRADEDPGDTPGMRQPFATPDALGGGRFRFSQLGADLRLFNPARTVALAARNQEADVPGPLRRRAVYDELEAARATLLANGTPSYRYFSEDDTVLRIFPVGQPEIKREEIQICDLSNWATLPPPRPLPGSRQTRVAVDPALGRLAFVSGAVPTAVQVSYHQGFSAEMGGGFYDRSDGFSDTGGLRAYEVKIAHPLATPDAAFQTALSRWVTDGRPDAIFLFTDSGTYAVSDISVPAGVRVELRAAEQQRPVLRLAATWHLSLEGEARLALDGLIVAGQTVEVTITDPTDGMVEHMLDLRHCTLVPGLRLDADGNAVEANGKSLALAAGAKGRLVVTLENCITGRIDLGPTDDAWLGVVHATACIIDGTAGADPALVAGEARVDRVTVLGRTQAGVLHASDTIFSGVIKVARTQTGCCRFSYAPPGSTVPRCYHCQPDLAQEHDETGDPDVIAARIVPSFTSQRYADPGYAQLGLLITDEIRAGASDGSEMGAFRDLHQPQREANLSSGLAEYLRFGLEAGIFFVT